MVLKNEGHSDYKSATFGLSLKFIIRFLGSFEAPNLTSFESVELLR
jgi:hypothetical protein